MYIDDLITDLNTEALISADDTALIVTGENTHYATTVLIEDLEKRHLWSKKLEIKCYADKLKNFIFFKESIKQFTPT